MIITLTANPSLDRTATLDAPLARGQVQRVSGVTVEPGGKGVNVARAIHYAGHPVRAVLPAPDSDPILAALRQLGVDYRTVAVSEGVRMNLTLTEADGTTTKLNEPGPLLDDDLVEQLAALVVAEAAGADWVVLSGSLPPGVPSDFYATLIRRLRPLGVKVAVDTSDEPLLALVDNFPEAAPDLLKPNSDELAQLTGADAEEQRHRRQVAERGKCLQNVEYGRHHRGHGLAPGHPDPDRDTDHHAEQDRHQEHQVDAHGMDGCGRRPPSGQVLVVPAYPCVD
jgi:1-phosphofructokinase